MEVFEDDCHWRELKSIMTKLASFHILCLKDLCDKVIWDNHLQDYKFYLYSFLARSVRIHSAILILLVYGAFHEALMLSRPFLENIVDTILFIKRKNRVRLMRTIRLYWLLNEERRVNFYKEEIDYFGFVTKYIKEHDERLEKEVGEGLKKFNNEEIEKMRKKIGKGYSWYGKNAEGGFKESGLFSEFDSYRWSCSLLHVREAYPFLVARGQEGELFIKGEFCETLKRSINHLKYYESFCSDVFQKNNISENLMNLEKKLRRIIYDISKQIDPNIVTFVPLEEDKFE